MSLKKSSFHLENLPIELKWSILTYLDPKSLINSLLICKSFLKVSKNDYFWKEMGEGNCSSTKTKFEIFYQPCRKTQFEKKKTKNFFRDLYIEYQKQMVGYSFISNKYDVLCNEIRSEYVFKVVCVGDRKVGKTSLVNTYANKFFSEKPLPHVYFRVCLIEDTFKKVKIKYRIWDPLNAIRPVSFAMNFFRGAHGVIIVFDLTKRSSFDVAIQTWVKEAREREQISSICVVGNKVDLKEKRVVQKEEALKICKDLGVEYFETSSKEEINVERLFNYCCRKIQKNKENGYTIKIPVEPKEQMIQSMKKEKKCITQ